MTDLTTPTLPIGLIHDHPDNPRRTAVADEEMIASIRAQGIAQAVTVMPHLGACADHPDVDCYTLGAGHRRKHGAIQANLDELPVVLREDLVTRAQQLAFMLTENLHRQDLTADEEIATYEQMTLEGFGADDIAALTGRSLATVKARLKLVALPSSAREHLHAGDMTLGDAEAMLEFADDPGATRYLEERLGTSNFRYALVEARNARDRRTRKTTAAAGFAAAGATEVAEGDEYTVLNTLPEEYRDTAIHDGCLGYRVPPSEWSDPYLVCTDVARHNIPAPAPREVGPSEWEKQQAVRAELEARRAAARATRLAWMVEHLTGLLPARSHGTLATAVQAFLPPLIIDGRGVPDDDVLLAALGAMPEQRDYASAYAARAAYAERLPRTNATQALGALAGFFAALVVERLGDGDSPQFIGDMAEAQHLLSLWDWMKAAGYPLSDQDKADRTALEVRHTELAAAAAEEEAEAS